MKCDRARATSFARRHFEFMPKFFLNLHDGDDIIEDPVGADLPSLAAARKLAIASARDILAEQMRDGQPLDGQKIEIADESGAVLATVSFREAFRLE